MKNRLFTFENFINNIEGRIINAENIQMAIKNNYKIRARNIEGLKNNKDEDLLDPIDLDEEIEKLTVSDGDGNIGYLDLKDVIEILTQKST
jgi:hypothetical protein